MTEQEYTNILIKDPRFTSPWIGKASTILEKMNGITEEEVSSNIEWIEQYNYEQLISINDMIDYNNTANKKIDLKIYADPALNGTQMQLFLNVFQKAEDTDFEEALLKLVNPKYTYEMLNWICSALADGLDLTDHIETFDPHQIAEIYSGFKDGVDVTKYDNAKIPAHVMNLIRHALGMGYRSFEYDPETDAISFE